MSSQLWRLLRRLPWPLQTNSPVSKFAFRPSFQIFKANSLPNAYIGEWCIYVRNEITATKTWVNIQCLWVNWIFYTMWLSVSHNQWCWWGSFTRPRPRPRQHWRGRARQLRFMPRRGRRKAVRKQCKCIELNSWGNPPPINTFSLHLKMLYYTQLKFCLEGHKHIYAKAEWVKVMKKDLITLEETRPRPKHRDQSKASKRRGEAKAALLLPRGCLEAMLLPWDIHHCPQLSHHPVR